MRHEIALSRASLAASYRCKPSVLIDNAEGVGIGAAADTRRVYLALELTRQCNLSCKHCYLSSGPYVNNQSVVDAEMWMKCLTSARRLGIQYVQLIGGEPTLHSMILVLLDRANELDFRGIEVYSNATKIDEKLFSSMKENGASMATSLYGCTPLEHDTFTGVIGSFNRTCNNIARALSMSIPVRVSIVRGKEDRKLVERTVAFTRQLGVEHVSSDIVREFGRGKGFKSGARRCAGCGGSVVRVCSDGKISGCAMDAEPSLGHIRDGLSAAVRKLAGICVAAKQAETRMT